VRSTCGAAQARVRNIERLAAAPVFLAHGFARSAAGLSEAIAFWAPSFIASLLFFRGI